MEVAKELRPKGTGKQDIQVPSGQKAETGGGPPGGAGVGAWRDKYGRLCIGSECFYAAVDAERAEVRVVVDDKGPCGGADAEDLKLFAEQIKAIVGQGGETVYQMKSRTS
jgi:hypothetical protein